MVSAGRDALATLRRGVSHVVLNTHEAPTADFVLDTDTRLPAARLRRSVQAAAGAASVDLVDATALATALLGDAIAANLFLLGFAWQQGRIPLHRDSLHARHRTERHRGRGQQGGVRLGPLCRRSISPRWPARPAWPPTRPPAKRSTRSSPFAWTHLTAYQSARLARRYRALVERVREAEGRRFSGGTALTEAVARDYAKLLAVKDE